MTVNYTTNLALGQPVTGTESGTWGDDVNNTVTSYLDIAIAGGLAITVTTADVTLTITQGTSVATNIGSTTAQYAILNVSGAMTAARNLIVPSSSRIYLINNNTTGGFALTVKGSATTGVTLVNGEKAHVFWNGTDYAKMSNASGGAGVFSSITNTGLTSGRVVYSTTGGLETDSANLTFNGTTLTANTIGAFTLGGTIAGGGNQINNVIIGTTTPLAGAFTTLSATGAITSTVTSGVFFSNSSGGTNSTQLRLNNTGGDLRVGIESSVGGVIQGGTSAYAAVFGNSNNYPAQIVSNNAVVGSFTSTGLAVTGTLSATGAGSIEGLTVGRGAGAVSTNTAVGASALAANTTGNLNTVVGYFALDANTTGASNSACGYTAMGDNTTGSSSVSVGVQSLASNTTGSSNTAVGYQALILNTTASQNTAVGYQSIYSNTTGTRLTAIGHVALYANTTGNDNTAVGQSALGANTTGFYNVAVGGYGGATQTLGSNTTGANNTAVGMSALGSNTTASNNTAVGYQAGYSNTTGAGNYFAGYRAGYTGTTCDNSVFIGYEAGYTTTANGNTFVGRIAGSGVTTGNQNAFFGFNSGYQVTSGAKNVIIGSYTGSAAPISATGSNYIVLSDGDGNVRGVFDGSGNLLVGTTTNASTDGIIHAQSATNKTALGAYAKGTTSNAIGYYCKVDSANALYAYWNCNGVNTGSISTNGTLTVYNTTSDYRLKTVIGAVTGHGERLDALEPIEYEWKSNGSRTRGFLAHKFQEVYANSVSGTKDAVDENGNPVYQGMQAGTAEVIADLVAELQSLRARVAQLESKP